MDVLRSHDTWPFNHGHRAPYERVTPPAAEGRECSIGENHVGQISWPIAPLESSPITMLSETTSQQTREMLSETSRSPSGSCTEEIEHRVESRRDLPKRSTTLPGKTHPRQLERKVGGVKLSRNKQCNHMHAQLHAFIDLTPLRNTRYSPSRMSFGDRSPDQWAVNQMLRINGSTRAHQAKLWGAIVGRP